MPPTGQKATALARAATASAEMDPEACSRINVPLFSGPVAGA